MKKRILTLGLFLTLCIFVAPKTVKADQNPDEDSGFECIEIGELCCTGIETSCGESALACGRTLAEIVQWGIAIDRALCGGN